MIYLLIATIIIAADQFTKHLIRSLPLTYTYDVIGNLLRIVHVENSGAAFGLFSGNRRFLLIVPAIVIAVAVVYIIRQEDQGIGDRLVKLSFTLIAAGGIGNMIDRLIFGHVTDMIAFSFFPPVFNVADIAVTCGCALMVISIIAFQRKGDQK